MARLVAWAARRWCPRRLPFVWRQGLANLYRPNNRTVLLLVSLGLGTFLVLTLYLARESLLREFRGSTGEDRPNLLFFDIQDDQLAGLEALVRSAGAPERQEAPIVTMRVSALKAGRSTRCCATAPCASGVDLRHEYRSTYRGQLTDTERVTAACSRDGCAGTEVVPVSLEEGLGEGNAGAGGRRDHL